jgi:hypothetical protein
MDFIIISLSSANAVSLGWLVQHDVIRSVERTSRSSD